MGGAGTGSTNLNDVWWSANGTDWNQLRSGASHWSRRNSLRATVFNNQLYLMGGFVSSSSVNDIWVLDVP